MIRPGLALFTQSHSSTLPSVTSIGGCYSFARTRTPKAVTIRWQGSASDQAAGIPRGIEPSRNLQVETGAYIRTYDLGRYREMKILYRHKAREEANKNTKILTAGKKTQPTDRPTNNPSNDDDRRATK